jgi:exosortase family protein XrtM
MAQQFFIFNDSYRREVRFTFLFLFLFGVLQFSYSIFGNSLTERLIIDDLTVKPSAFIINILAPQEQVQSFGHSLISPWVRLNIVNGCEGIESIFLVTAALLAYHLPLRAKIKGIVLITALLYALNQLRITAMYFSYRYDRSLFSALHGYIGPTLIVLIGSLFFLWWITKHPSVKT